MTIEELQEFLSTDEGRKEFDEFFQEYAKENGFKTIDEVEGLIKKNKQLLKQEVDIKKKLKEKENIAAITEDQQKILDFLDERDILELEDLENKFSTDGKQDSSIDPLQLKRLQREKDDLANQLSEISGKYTQEKEKGIAFQREAVLTQAITKAKVKPEMFKAVYALFNSQIKSEESENGYNFIIEDSESGLPVVINEFIAEWSKTDEAKGFLQEPVNVGSGGQMQNANGSKTIKRSEWQKLPPEQQHKTVSEGVNIID